MQAGNEWLNILPKSSQARKKPPPPHNPSSLSALSKWVSLPFCATRSFHALQHSTNGSLSLSVQSVHPMFHSTQKMGLSPFLCNPFIPCFAAASKWDQSSMLYQCCVESKVYDTYDPSWLGGSNTHTHSLSLMYSDFCSFLSSCNSRYSGDIWPSGTNVTGVVSACAHFVSVFLLCSPNWKGSCWP